MSRVNTPLLSKSEKSALEQGARTGKTPCFRARCEVILLKAIGLTSEQVAKFTAMTYVSVNGWTKRYQEEGIEGLQTKTGRGRKAVVSVVEDKESVLQAIKANRQRIETAKAEWEQETNKSVSLSTFKSFLKVLTDDISE
ncbi:helix-turn-helix domain-containing protein [Hymenobacter psoromatis]|uniref:helix-turn-helix domain-containing protein n=1 Tax=Hymenobacter psoromatis TaxID=1484116 RepID=UPI001CC09AE9|nr:helix-turn-helix domain-containing protein [Hymenobacter psoromatis]